MLSDWAHAQGSTVVQCEHQEYDVKKKHQKPQIFVKGLDMKPLVIVIFRIVSHI